MDIEGTVKLQSSNLSTSSYDSQKKTLTLTFNEGGIYEYYAVPQIVDYELRQAASSGKYFHSFIRTKYSFKRVG